MKRLLFLGAGTVGGVLVWNQRGHVQSIAVRKLAATVGDPLRKRGMRIRIPAEQGGWIRTTLKADLGPALSEVVGYPLEAAAHSHFGGFNLSGVYSDFINPDSEYYQAWLGAYVAFESEGRCHFGFDDSGRPVQQDVLNVLEADQRMVLGGAGCPNWFPADRRVRLLGDLSVTEVESGGTTWWRLDGKAETWSAYHRGTAAAGNGSSELVYGRVPDGAPHDVEDFHPLTYTGSFWQRYDPEWHATLSKFFACPTYVARDGREVGGGQGLAAECEQIMEATVFFRE